MSNVKRVYVEKKPEFAVAAKGLRHEIRHYLGLQDVTNVRVLIRYIIYFYPTIVFFISIINKIKQYDKHH